ncbi:MAG: YbjN domain-containing protein [Alphaproteobacteria bacterium]
MSEPINILEHIAQINGWVFERDNEEEATIALKGRWSDYSLHFSWHGETRSLQLACHMEKLKLESDSRLFFTLNDMNQRVWMGHFEMDDEGGIIFRHTQYIGSIPSSSMQEILAIVIEAAVNEANRFYPALNFLEQEKEASDEDLAIALLDVMGQA